MLLFKLFFAILISSFVFGGSDHQDHHSHHQKLSSNKLKLNQGRKWTTDQTLRTNMSAIHNLIKANLEGIHNNKLTINQYKELGKRIKLSIDNIFKNCNLEPEADAQLHIVLSDILSMNSKLLESSDTKEKQQAIEQILLNYNIYTNYFDHKVK